MKPYYEDASVTLWHGDCLDVLRSLPGASVDAVVTDPPYGLGFMGQKWDTYANEVGRAPAAGAKFDHVGGNHNPSNAADAARTRRVESRKFGDWCESWTAECLRVLKPGGHMLAFGGTRTWHRLACAVEDAGFEVRDSIAWLYGSGFPKSLDVSKAIDKTWRGEMVRAKLLHFAAERGVDGAWLEAHGVASGSSFADWTVGGHVPSDRNWQLVKAALDVTPEEEAVFERAITATASSGIAGGTGRHAGNEGCHGYRGVYDITAPATPDAARWQGWGTALKPAFEPVVVARKPLVGTVAANVLAHGTGALNIDGCRVATDEKIAAHHGTKGGVVGFTRGGSGGYTPGDAGKITHSAGRWPTNVVLDDSQAEVLDEMSGEAGGGTGRSTRGGGAGGDWNPTDRTEKPGQTVRGDGREIGYGDTGGASRFFPTFRYEAKAPASERPKVNGTAHPTVKPLDLMRWLVRLVTPPGGTVLEPFAGSGTTVEACIVEGFRCIAIEREADYLPLITQRINRRRNPVAYIEAAGEDLGLFNLEGEPA